MSYCIILIFVPCIFYNVKILLPTNALGQAEYTLPDDGLHGPKRVGVTVKKCFNANFNILYVK